MKIVQKVTCFVFDFICKIDRVDESRMRPTTLTLHKLFGEVAASAYVIRHRIQLQHLTKLWTALSDFIRASIERRKVLSFVLIF